MKNIFRKLHIGSGHEPNRSGETSSATSSSVIISTAGTVATPCSSDHRTVGFAPSVPPEISLPSPVEGASALVADRVDYFSSEEEFQMQLALAISASNSEFREDLDGDQIRTATLLSLGTHRGDQIRQEEGVAESLSRRYWDYDVLDYNEKVVDGFYDIFGLPTNLHHGKMPSLHDLQTSIGDLGFEVIVVNRAVDTALVELEQVAHCIALDVSATEVMFLVQRLSELVSQNMGGPVKDANDILARWVDKSTELRTSLQTSLLPIGCINVGLSRHRALLFKVLADNIGITCKLVKGSHYTGVDEDAINIIKHGDDREFLVDLMSAPGTLIPADVLSTKEASLIPSNPILTQNLLHREIDNSGDYFPTGTNGYYKLDGDKMFDRSTKTEKAVMQPFVVGESSTSSVSNSSRNTDSIYSQGLLYQLPSSNIKNLKQESNKVPEFASMNEKKPKTLNTGDTLDPNNYFADLNPFQTLKVGNTNESGRPLHQSPLIRKNRLLMNDVSNMKHYNYSEGVVRKNLEDKDPNISRNTPIATGSIYANPFASSGSDDILSGNPDCSNGDINTASKQNDKLGNDGVDHLADDAHIQVQFKKDGVALHNKAFPGQKAHKKNINGKPNSRKFLDDKLLARNVASESRSPLVSSPTSRSNRIDPVLDDVAEWEIPWEDLVIGERIGLGSYGEVYHADWNGTEVAVKKFLDQDFYGDALDEFRSEVRIMRRLHHPNVVLFMGAVTRPPNLSIVSEFLPRGSLYRILHRPSCQIDERRRIKMALDVAKGMNCLHTSAPTIVHRDLKSPNLLVDKNWTVKVCDFGLSRLKHSTFLSSKSTAGTPEWMAPEVLRNEPSNEKCDVYSFGVILWELATLRMPWSGMNPMQVVGAVGFQERRLEIPKEVDPLVERIIWSCWQTEPSLRPSFSQLKSALKSLQRLVIPSHLDSQSASVSHEIQVNSPP